MENSAPLPLVEAPLASSSTDLNAAEPGLTGVIAGTESHEVNALFSRWLPAGIWGQLIRFGLVGVINTAVDLGVLNTLIYLKPTGRAGVLFSLFKTIAFSVAVINSYLLNRKFTFQSSREASTGQLTQYLVISVVGLMINVGVASLVMNLVTPPEMLSAWWPSIAAVSGIPFGLVWNFVGYRLLVF